MPYSEFWNNYLERVERTEKNFKKLNDSCLVTLKTLWKIDIDLWKILRKRNQQLPPNQTFVSIYYRRNMFYLYSAHALACMGFCDPSMNIQRTVYESILRGYYFLLFESEAKDYMNAYDTENEIECIRKLSHGTLISKLFKDETKTQFKKVYKMLCRFSHPDVRGTLRDFPNYDEKYVEDRLKFVLSLAYGNIQMLAEGFFDLLDKNLKKIIRAIMFEIIVTLDREIPNFTPDKRNLLPKIRLKHGNFNDKLT